MIKSSLLATLFVLAATGAAHAGGQSGAIGLGAEYQLNGIGGVSLNYDAGQFHVGGLLGFFDPPGGGNTVFEVGGRFYYHVHSTAMADFGLGGQLGLASVPNAMNNRDADVFLEPGFQIRVFVASNVALSFDGGIVIGVVDASGIAITGQGVGTSLTVAGGNVGLVGGAGVHYYFF
jgi:hypothetical protein